MNHLKAERLQNMAHKARHLALERRTVHVQFLLGSVVGTHLDVGLERPHQRQQEQAIRFQRAADLFQQRLGPGAAVQQVERADHVVFAATPAVDIFHPADNKIKKKEDYE